MTFFFFGASSLRNVIECYQHYKHGHALDCNVVYVNVKSGISKARTALLMFGACHCTSAYVIAMVVVVFLLVFIKKN